MSSIITKHEIGSMCKVLRGELLIRGHVNVRFVMETLNHGRIMDDGSLNPILHIALPNEGHFKSITCISTLYGEEVKVTLSKNEGKPTYKVTFDTGGSHFASSTFWGLDNVFFALRLATIGHSEQIKAGKRGTSL
ncbi:hypothetical protein OTK49_28330 [Vibrio coralliirubri]|uniref:hypothetical protein n=1 Tax=Vibrio coralliirubri TaxID=1516159 RepID=UPI0022838AC0|nr:hypothetical protein [Vibrio coralliirubri]MCY9866451.1 hypothetical protein [Vibrio coralliirubri]